MQQSGGGSLFHAITIGFL